MIRSKLIIDGEHKLTIEELKKLAVSGYYRSPLLNDNLSFSQKKAMVKRASQYSGFDS